MVGCRRRESQLVSSRVYGDALLTLPRPQVIVTSYLFPKATFDLERLRRLSEKVEKRRLVVDVRSDFA